MTLETEHCAADREALLVAKIAQLHHDIEAQRKALARVIDERDQWRNAYGRLHGKVMQLAAVRATVAEVSRG